LAVDADDADANGDEPILHENKCVGFVTSGGYGHYTRTSLAQGYIDADLLDHGNEFQVEILGELRSARIETGPRYDPTGARMRL
jgi:dimethylglycine dehydrogenase